MEMSNISEFVTNANKEISERNLKEGDYCIIIYKCKGIYNEIKKTAFVYSNIKNFEEKIDKHYSEISPDYGISFELWMFD